MGREDMTCRNCGEPIGDNTEMCAHCTTEYMRENNERIDRLKPLDIIAFDKAIEKFEKMKELWRLDLGMDNILNRGI